MTTALLLILALALGAVGLAVGWLLGRQQSASRDERELARTREELANARTETAEVRTEAAEARTGAAEAEAMVAHAQAQVAKAVAERDGAVARAQEIAADREAMLAQFKALSSETAERQGKAVDTVTAQRLQATEQLLAPVAASLQKFEARLIEVEKERVAMTTDLRAHVREVRDTGEALRKETASLVTALRKPQVRGSWGETQLKRVAEMAGMVERCDFDVQLTAQSDGQSLRPDMRVHLAEGKYVFVDSKVPLAAFLDAAETEDEQQRAAHLTSFARHVRTHVDQLSGKKYWKVGESPEFVVLFLPSEAFFVAALEQNPDLYEYAIGRNVVIATPTTLIGMLRAVSYGWKQAALAETAAEVFRLGRELHERLGQMGSRFDKLGRAIRSSVNAYNETIASVEGRVLVQARRFRDLQVTEKELEALTSVDEPVRQIQAPELVDDAAQVPPMVGRTPRSRRTEPPEAEALFRADPDVDELVSGEADRGQTGESAVGS
ncbi:DNA recombination protein RmuC [Nocardioides sp.]|uniref:DNA recombination protein RmuC n=1 Tax=Nocardioides sp. TaxID=35761 RepID=UPI001A3521BE|nr:DNA recombination protein RmuC [Nocardioides sp.]MBJ7356050.1 DNA recombination protein RmuC [Nocardioides sp.]